MRYFIWLVSFLFLHQHYASAQQSEILLVGVLHEIPETQKCNWEKPYQQLFRYKPDQVAVEWMMPDDPLSLNKAYGPTYRSKFDSIMLQLEGGRVNIKDSIALYSKRLQQNANPYFRFKLWQYYYLNIDIGNAEYQLFCVLNGSNAWMSSFDSSGSAAKFFLRNLRRAKSDMKNTEHYNMVFPLALAMGIELLYPTDDKSTYTYQSGAFGRLAEALKGTAVYKKMEAFWQRYTATENEQKKNCDAVTFINRKEWLDSTDVGQVRILSEADHSDVRDYATIWYYRNKSIAKRINEAVIKSKAKRMAVFYGNMHIYPLKMYLEEMGYKVKLLSDLK